MKKTRGKKKSVPSRKKKRFFAFLESNKVAPLVFILVFSCLALGALLIFHPATGSTITGGDTYYILDSSAPAAVTTVTDFFNIGGTWKEIIIGIIVLAIIFAGMYDILELTSIFSNRWVMIIIAAGLAVIAALLDIVRSISTWLFAFAATLGAIGIAVEIVICIVIFIGLSFGGTRIAMWAAKRRAQAAIVKGIQGGGRTAGAIAGLKRIQGEFEKK